MFQFRVIIASVLIGLLYPLYPALAKPRNIIIRFTAVSFFYQQDYQPNRPLDILTSKAGFDIAFRTQYYDDQTFYLVPGGTPEVLAAGGNTALRESDTLGNQTASCDGTLRYDPKFPPQLRDVTQDGPIKTIRIMIPGINNNTHAGVGLLSDPSQFYFACATPQIGTFVSGSEVQQTFEWYPKGNIIPEDSNTDSAGLVRGTNAVFQFDIRKLPVSVPLAFVRDSRSSSLGKLIDEQKHVWFGQVDIFPDTGAALAPTDPFTYRGFLSPQSLNSPPANPPPELAPPTKSEWNTWLPDITDTITDNLKKIVKDWQRLVTGASYGLDYKRVISGASYDYLPANSTARVLNLPAAPGGGIIQLQLVLRETSKTKGFKPKLRSKATINSLVAGQATNVSTLFDSKTKRDLSSRKAFTAYALIRVAKANGQGTVNKVVKFKKARR